MNSLSRRIAACIALSLAFVLPARASTTGVDFTDLWFIPAESGWGINLIQQTNVIFATLFVYRQDSSPTWYVASDLESTNGTSFSGTLFKTSGPFFGAQWTGNATTPAGNMTLVFDSPNTATLTYTADGTTVTKNIVRQTWRSENLSGNYLGGLTAHGTGCASGQNTDIIMFGSMSVTQANAGQTTLVINFTTNNNAPAVCTFTGNYAQSGRHGALAGNWSCTVSGAAANVGTFNMTELEATVRGFNGRFQGTDQFCTYDGNVGVVRDTLQ